MTTLRPLGLVLSLACSLAACSSSATTPDDAKAKGKAPPSTDEEAPAEPETKAQTPAEPETKPDVPAPEKCETDADCSACATERRCGCFATVEACPPTLDSCFVDPCMHKRAVCAAGRCVMPPAVGPCKSDDDCETRPDPFACKHVPARKEAPQVEGDFVCGERPKAPPVQCDTGKHECVLVGAAAPAPVDVDFTLACTLYGTAMSTTTTVVTSAPAKFTQEAHGKTPITATPTSAQLGELSKILASPEFATFMSAKPTREAAPHPGQTKCELQVRAPKLKVATKKYDREDEYAADAQKAREDFEAALRAAVPAPKPTK